MTLTTSTTTPSAALPAQPRPPRTELDLAAVQLRAIERFHRARRLQEQEATASASTREMRMDAARTMEVLRRQHEAVIATAHAQLRDSGAALRRAPERRVVLAHRNAWFLDRLGTALADGGVRVVARVDNGADAVGVVVAEQPDLVLVEDTLAMVPGEDVVRQVREFAPEALVVAQVAHGGRVAPLLEAGASSVYVRQVPPADVAASVLEMLTA
jgi:hypothetical protein